MGSHVLTNSDGSLAVLNDEEYGEVKARGRHAELIGAKFAIGAFLWFLIIITMNDVYYIRNGLDSFMYSYFEFMFVDPFKFVMSYLETTVMFNVALIASVIFTYKLYNSRFPRRITKILRWIGPAFYFLPYLLWQGASLFYY